jgi:hypothetical protein
MIGKFRWTGEERKWAKCLERSRVGRGGKKEGKIETDISMEETGGGGAREKYRWAGEERKWVG